MSQNPIAHTSEETDAEFYNPSIVRSALNYLRLLFFGNFKTTIVLLYAIFALTIWKYIPSAPAFADAATGRTVLTVDSVTLNQPLDGALRFTALQFLWNARKIWAAFLIMGVFPALIVKFVFKEKLSDYGLGLPSLRRSVTAFLCLLPVFIIMGWVSGYTKEFYHVYPYNPLAGASWTCLILHSALYLLLYYTAWEFMFRGFVQLGLTQTLGPVPAILIQVVASTMLHYGHPASETFGCIAGGLLWGFLVYRTKSIWSGWGQHAILGIALDWSLVLNAS